MDFRVVIFVLLSGCCASKVRNSERLYNHAFKCQESWIIEELHSTDTIQVKGYFPQWRFGYMFFPPIIIGVNHTGQIRGYYGTIKERNDHSNTLIMVPSKKPSNTPSRPRPVDNSDFVFNEQLLKLICEIDTVFYCDW